MPKLISKIEGRGNGIKTNISNMGEISRALKRPPMYPTKFFGCELGAMAKFEEAEEKALVNGAHKESDLVSILDKFIQMYVLCPGCELPEIDISVKKGLLTCKCNACGHVGSLDNVHKAATYMVRNPPDAASSTMGKKKKSKEERRAEKQQQQREKRDRISRKGKSLEEDDNEDKEGDNGGDDKAQGNGDEESGTANSTSNSGSSHSFADEATIINDIEAQSTKKPQTERGGDVTPKNDEDSESRDEQPQEKVRESRRKDRREKRFSAGSEADKRLLHKEALVFDSPELQDVIDRLRHLVVKNEKVDISLFFQELRMLQVSQDFDAKCRMYVTIGALFKDGITPESLEKRMAYISKVVDSSVSAADVLDALGHFCYEQGTANFANFPYYLQKLYIAEILEADDILKYYKKEKADPIYTACRKHAGPFLQWLREDEDEEEKSFSSSDDEDEEEDDEELDEGRKGSKGRRVKENGGETTTTREKGQKEKIGKKKDETKKREEDGKMKKGGEKGRTGKDDDNEDDEEYKDIGEKKTKNSGSNNGIKEVIADANQTEETGSGGDKAKGRKDDNGQKSGGGKGKRREK